MSQTVRTFIALPAGPDVRAVSGRLIDRLKAASADVKWVEPENLHVTLKFLGDVELKEVPRICQAVERAAAEVEPFELAMQGVGAFPNPARPRTVWLGSEGDEPSMRSLQEKIESRLQKLGFRREARRFHAHLTLGRVRQGGPAMTRLAELLGDLSDSPGGVIPVRELIVFSSQLAPTGPTYAPLGRAKLGG